ncbi:MAG: K(+)-transporting ATPase subunit F [Arenimonas sp.]
MCSANLPGTKLHPGDRHDYPIECDARTAWISMSILLWILIVAVAIYLVVAMLRPDKF